LAALLEATADRRVQLLSVVVGEIVELDPGDELENGSVGQIGRLVEDDPTVLNSSAESVRHRISLALGRLPDPSDAVNQDRLVAPRDELVDEALR